MWSRILDQHGFILATTIENYAVHLHDQLEPFAKANWGNTLSLCEITDFKVKTQ